MPKHIDHNVLPDTDYVVLPIHVAVKKPKGSMPNEMAVNKMIGIFRDMMKNNYIADFVITENRIEEVTSTSKPAQGELFW